MPQKPHVSDYEPVRRIGGAAASDDRGFDVDEGFDSDLHFDAALRNATSAQSPVTVAPAPVVDPPRQTTVSAPPARLRKGHLFTYIVLMIFTFLVYFRPYEIFPSLKWTSSSAFWVALLTMLLYIPTQLALEGKLTTPLRQVNLLLLLLFFGFLSIPLATDRSIAWTSFVEYTKVVVTFIIIANVLRTETRFRLMIMLMLVVSCWMSIGAVNDYRLGVFNLPGQRIEGVIGGLFDNPNDMALHLMTMIPITLALFITSRHFLGKLVYPICIAIMMAGIVASFSRGGSLGLITAIGFMAWRLAKRNRGLFLAGALVLCAVFFALAPGDFQARMTLTGDSSSIARQNDLKRSIFILLHHPLLGVGMNNYILFSNTDHATHNSYTQVGSEMGVPALIVYVMFLLSAIKPLREIGRETADKKTKSRYRYLAAGLEASMIGYMVASFFASVVYLWYLYYLVGYTICIARLYQASKAEVTVSSPTTNKNTARGRVIGEGPEPNFSVS